jgi:hypothetical protein
MKKTGGKKKKEGKGKKEEKWGKKKKKQGEGGRHRPFLFVTLAWTFALPLLTLAVLFGCNKQDNNVLLAEGGFYTVHHVDLDDIGKIYMQVCVTHTRARTHTRTRAHALPHTHTQHARTSCFVPHAWLIGGFRWSSGRREAECRQKERLCSARCVLGPLRRPWRQGMRAVRARCSVTGG